MDERDPPHYLAALRSATVPRRLVWFDCASERKRDGGVFMHEWCTGVVGTTHWTSRKHERVDTMQPAATPADLWDKVDNFCGSNRRVVMFCWGLDRQLRLSQALTILPSLGWSLHRIVLERQSAWAAFRDNRRSLLLCDLRSWCPVDFGRVFSAVVHRLPANEASLQERRSGGLQCMARALTIREAVLSLIEWTQGEGLGPFRPTGSGASYAAFRRRFLSHRLLVHDDQPRLAAEREAMHTGRCEVWRHGTLPRGRYVEYDLRAAYATIAADSAIPAVARPPLIHPTWGVVQEAMRGYAVLANVTVTTDLPRVPCRYGGRTVWPVGTFTTWLWDPELSLLQHDGVSVKVHAAYPYTRKPVLSAFAEWVLAALDGNEDKHPDIALLALKHWSRCMIGRLGLRYRSWEPFTTSPDNDVRLVNYHDIDSGVSTDLLIVGHDWFLLSGMQEATESLPQIPSWIMSECRRRLWAAMSTVGLDNVVYVDTDSVIVDQSGSNGHWGAVPVLKRSGWVQKGTYPWLTLHSPRNIDLENDRRVAGLPRTARQTAPLEYTGEVMRSVKESMRNGQLGTVVEVPRKFHLAAIDNRRTHLSGHATEPVVIDGNGTS